MDAATLALSKHLLPPLTHSDSCQLVTDLQDHTQHKCVCDGCDLLQRKASVSVSARTGRGLATTSCDDTCLRTLNYEMTKKLQQTYFKRC